jgi:hypothetical protein
MQLLEAGKVRGKVVILPLTTDARKDVGKSL